MNKTTEKIINILEDDKAGIMFDVCNLVQPDCEEGDRSGNLSILQAAIKDLSIAGGIATEKSPVNWNEVASAFKSVVDLWD